MQQTNFEESKLAINIGLDAQANIKAESSINQNEPSTPIDIKINESDISLSVDVNVSFNTLSSLIEIAVQQKRIQLKAPFFKLDIGFHKIVITAGEKGNLQGEAHFSGTHSGIIYFEGKPVLDSEMNKLKIEEVKQQVKTSSVLINIGKWLFQKKIESDLKKLTTIDLNVFYNKAILKIEEAINKVWSPGISSIGNIQTVKAKGITILRNTILIQLMLQGAVQLILDAKEMSAAAVTNETNNIL